MYAYEIHHRCAFTTRAHILKQCHAAFDVTHQVLQLCERRLKVRSLVVQRSFEVITASRIRLAKRLESCDFDHILLALQEVAEENLLSLHEYFFVPEHGSSSFAWKAG